MATLPRPSTLPLELSPKVTYLRGPWFGVISSKHVSISGHMIGTSTIENPLFSSGHVILEDLP